MSKKKQSAAVPKVRMLWHTPDPQKMIAVAARMCYSGMSVSKLTESLEKPEIDRMVKHILEVRHYSVLRHVIFAFTIEGVSRSFSHQFVRHHVGFDVEQRSQHYRREKQFDYNIPQGMQHPGEEEAEDMYIEHMQNSQQVYDRLIALGHDKAETRQVLPNACETQLVCTLNLNAAINFMGQRSCRLNTPEILKVAIQMRKLMTEVIPEAAQFLGPPCWTAGICYEGERRYMKSCMRPWQTPTVLWDSDFPKTVRTVGIVGGQHHDSSLTSLKLNNVAYSDKAEPSQEFQQEQGDDSKNNS